MINLYLTARKIHRVLVLIITSFSFFMAITGVMLKYPKIGYKLGLDGQIIRYIHNQLSPWLTITLMLMAGTGLFMYFYIGLKRKS